MEKVLMVVWVAVVALFADVVVLVDGRRIEGTIVKETEREVVIRVSQGELSIPRERIDEIVRGRKKSDEYEEKAKEAKSAEEHYRLGMW
ncbi:MAG: hypothetical protein N2234_09200, partial [Planctomycetota bacterium]|nr:hypothetical protein [Planctomycetota bacterium]